MTVRAAILNRWRALSIAVSRKQKSNRPRSQLLRKRRQTARSEQAPQSKYEREDPPGRHRVRQAKFAHQYLHTLRQERTANHREG